MNFDLTNALLTTLIAILLTIGRIFYKKFVEFAAEFKTIGQELVGQTKDIQYLRRDVDEHEVRITVLETKRN